MEPMVKLTERRRRSPPLPRVFHLVALAIAVQITLSALVMAPEAWAAVAIKTHQTRIAGFEQPLTVGFSPDGKYLVTGDARGVAVRDARTLRIARIFASSEGAGPLIAFSRNGRLLATGSAQGQILVFDLTNGALLTSLGPIVRGRYMWEIREATYAIAEVTAIAISGDGTYVAAAENIGEVWASKYYTWSSTVVHVWEVRTGRKVAILRGHASPRGSPAKVLSLAFHPNGKILASGAEDATARLWAVPTGQLLATLNHRGRTPHSLAFTRDGRQLVSATRELVRVWNLRTRRVNAVASVWSAACCYETFESMVVHPSGRLIAAGLSDNTVRIWNLSGGKPLRTIGSRAQLHWVTSVAFSPDGRILATAIWRGDPQMSMEVWNLVRR